MGEIQGYGSERYLFRCIVKASLDSILRMILKKRKGHSNMKNYRAELTGVFGAPFCGSPEILVDHKIYFPFPNLEFSGQLRIRPTGGPHIRREDMENESAISV